MPDADSYVKQLYTPIDFTPSKAMLADSAVPSRPGATVHDLQREALTDDYLAAYDKINETTDGYKKALEARTYLRAGDTGWGSIVARVVRGLVGMRLRQYVEAGQVADWEYECRMAKEVYDAMFFGKVLPAGRGLWALGTVLTEERGLYAAAANCFFVSTRGDFPRKVAEAMDLAMLGVGIGFDTLAVGQKIQVGNKPAFDFVVPDSREGWVTSVWLLFCHFLYGEALPKYDFSLVREEGLPINGFGGLASGPGPLRRLLDRICQILAPLTELTVQAIVDIFCAVGECVVAGNIRRTSLLAKLDPGNPVSWVLKCWDHEVFATRSDLARFANHSLAVNTSADRVTPDTILPMLELAQKYGEPGMLFESNIREHNITRGEGPLPDVFGTNPCGEQTLEPDEPCVLIEINLPAWSKTDRERPHKIAAISSYVASTMSLMRIKQWPECEAVMKKNARTGIGLTGLRQVAVTPKFLTRLRDQTELAVYRQCRLLRSVAPTRMFTIKPSGNLSEMLGVTPGAHPAWSQYIRRNVTIAANSWLVPLLREAGVPLEEKIADIMTGRTDPKTLIATFYRKMPGAVTYRDVDVFEQLDFACMLQECWSDNQVSLTVTVKREEWAQINKIAEHVAMCVRRGLKSVTFLTHDDGTYPQMPFNVATKAECEEGLRRQVRLCKLIADSMKEGAHEAEAPPAPCEGDVCMRIDN